MTDDRSILIKTIADLRSLEAESGIIGGSTIVSDSLSKSSDAEALAAEAADDANELALLAQEEREGCARELIQIEERLVRMLTPKDEADERGVVLEVRSGTGKILFIYVYLRKVGIRIGFVCVLWGGRGRQG